MSQGTLRPRPVRTSSYSPFSQPFFNEILNVGAPQMLPDGWLLQELRALMWLVVINIIFISRQFSLGSEKHGFPTFEFQQYNAGSCKSGDFEKRGWTEGVTARSVRSPIKGRAGWSRCRQRLVWIIILSIYAKTITAFFCMLKRQ